MPENELVSNAYYPLVFFTFITSSQMLSAAIIERVPRRSLLLGSTLACSLGLFFLGTIFYLEPGPQWKWVELGVTIAHVSIYGSVAMPVFHTVSSELLPVSIKGRVSAMSVFIRAIFALAGYQLFDMMTSYFGVFSNFYFYAVNTVLVAVVTYFFLPETRGKTLAEVQIDVEKRKV